MEKAKRIFKSNPEAKELHQTSDGHYFFDKNHANNHASTQKEKTVKTITREQVEAWKEEVKEEKPAEEKKAADKK